MQIEFNKTAKFFIGESVTKPKIKMRLKHNTYDYNVVTIPLFDKRNKIILLSILPTAENSQYPASGFIYLKYGGHYTVEFFASDNTNLTIEDGDLFIKSEQVYYKTQIAENYAMPGNRATKSLPTEQNNRLVDNKLQTYTFTFEPNNPEQVQFIRVLQTGKVQQIEGDVVYKVVTGQNVQVQIGDTLNEGDLLKVTQNSSQKTIIVASYADLNKEIAMKTDNTKGDYNYILNLDNTEVVCFEAFSPFSIVKTFNIGSYVFNKRTVYNQLFFDYIDNKVVLFCANQYNYKVVEINADSSSTNFNSIALSSNLNHNLNAAIDDVKFLMGEQCFVINSGAKGVIKYFYKTNNYEIIGYNEGASGCAILDVGNIVLYGRQSSRLYQNGYVKELSGLGKLDEIAYWGGYVIKNKTAGYGLRFTEINDLSAINFVIENNAYSPRFAINPSKQEICINNGYPGSNSTQRALWVDELNNYTRLQREVTGERYNDMTFSPFSGLFFTNVVNKNIVTVVDTSLIPNSIIAANPAITTTQTITLNIQKQIVNNSYEGGRN